MSGSSSDAAPLGAGLFRAFAPRSIALVGASERPGSFGRGCNPKLLRSAANCCVERFGLAYSLVAQLVLAGRSWVGKASHFFHRGLLDQVNKGIWRRYAFDLPTKSVNYFL